MKKQSGPKHLSSLFDRYKNVLKAPEKTVIDTATVVISELLDISIAPEQLAYSPQTRTLHIKNGMLRSTILPHREDVLSHLKGRLGVQSAPKNIL